MISVIVPVYNASKYLRACIDSIMAQTYSDFELILVNDGSSDNSLEICQSYLSDHRVTVLSHDNHGVSFTRNQGLAVAKGDYITFVDSDDTIPQKAFETLMTYSIANDADLVKGNYYFNYSGKIMPHASGLSKGNYKKEELLPILIDDGTLSGFLISSTCCVLYNRNIIEKHQIRFDVDLKNNEDGLFNFKYILYSEKPIVETGICVYYVRKHEDNNSSKRAIDYNFNVILKKSISSLNIDEKQYQIELQFKRRNVTLVLWDIMHFSPQLEAKKALVFIGKKVDEIQDDISYIEPQRLNKYKKVMYYLMKSKKSYLLYFMSKYVIPFLSSKVKR